jgi:hypothetical protein
MKTVCQLMEELLQIPGDLEVFILGQGESEGCPVVPKVVAGLTFDSNGRDVAMLYDEEDCSPDGFYA